MKILYIAPVRDCSGYAEAARNYINALHSVGADVVVRSLKFDHQQYKLSNLHEEFLKKPTNDIDVVIQHTTPNTSEPKQGVKNFLYMAWETSVIPKSWGPLINRFDGVMVPCQMNVEAVKAGGVTIPVHKVPHTFDLSRYNGPREEKKLPQLKDRFTFYNICQLTKKKGIDRLLIAYLTEFRHDEPVALFLKAYVNANFGQDDTKQVSDYVNTIKEGLKLDNYPPVFCNVDILPEEKILSLHKQLDCYVCTSRGSGWEIPTFEAMAAGTPTISIAWGGPVEYISGCVPVDYHLENVVGQQHSLRDHYTGRELWAIPDLLDLRKKMRQVFEHQTDSEALVEREITQSCEGSGLLTAQAFTYDKIGNEMLSFINNTIEK